MSDETLWVHPAGCERCDLGERRIPIVNGGLDAQLTAQCACLLQASDPADWCDTCYDRLGTVVIPDGHEHRWRSVFRHPSSPQICLACLTERPAPPPTSERTGP